MELTHDYMRPSVIRETTNRLEAQARRFRQQAYRQSVPAWRVNFMRLAAEADEHARRWRAYLPDEPRRRVPDKLLNHGGRCCLGIPVFGDDAIQTPDGLLEPYYIRWSTAAQEYQYGFRITPRLYQWYGERQLQILNGLVKE